MISMRSSLRRADAADGLTGRPGGEAGPLR